MYAVATLIARIAISDRKAEAQDAQAFQYFGRLCERIYLDLLEQCRVWRSGFVSYLRTTLQQVPVCGNAGWAQPVAEQPMVTNPLQPMRQHV